MKKLRKSEVSLRIECPGNSGEYGRTNTVNTRTVTDAWLSENHKSGLTVLNLWLLVDVPK